ncbi:hypothetical protein DCAR_0624021 [Daucus carota subsp. sativus]|uniref:pectinesterase n=1 Tax=Daucus carota subsp. sativus TaxID=79200 RepID=A0AAF1B3A7_DAUCS|nr:PREDICTED: probable pectinesterase/pectinesterase inhibitor 58 [Daucus carota subsp. sativus]WOH04610.1 hypothetical protein DCAR_0624021 [Daucus carota subsp. sativus]
MDEGKKRILVLSVSSLLLVAIVVGVVVCVVNTKEEKTTEVSTSTKAIKTLCESVDYQDTCVEGLSSKEYNQTDDPKELVKIGFAVAMKQVKSALNKSSTLQELEQDPRSKEALKTCSELADSSVRDLERSFEKFSDLDIAELNAILADLKVWISGAMTSEQTCLDGFQNTTGEAGDKMKEALKVGMQMTTNALAMVSEIATAFEQINNNQQAATQRRLLSFSDWFDPAIRLLIQDPPKKFEANVDVAQDGSGKYKTINEALKEIPKSGNKTFVIHIKEGVYEEKVEIFRNMTNVLMIGDGPNKTRITGKLNVIDGTPTYKSATVAIGGDNFIAKDIGFENSAGSEKEQAVALRVSADKTIFYNCWMDGYQDTLYTHTYRQFYRDCSISGTIDFVFGDAAAVFQNCTFLVRKPLENQRNIVTAQGRKNVRQPTGLVLQNCTITADSSLQADKSKFETFLARPWKEYSRTVIMESFIDDVIKPEGYLPWNETFALETLFYTEYNNRGPSSSKDKRVKWPGIKELTTERIKRFTAASFIEGDTWIARTKVPYASGLIQPPPQDEPAASPISPEEDVDFNRTESKTQSELLAVLKTPPSSPQSSGPPPPPSSSSGSPSPSPSSGPGSSPAAAPAFDDSPGPGPSNSGPVSAPELDPFDFGTVFDSQPSPPPPASSNSSSASKGGSPSPSPASSSASNATHGSASSPSSSSTSNATHGSASSPGSSPTSNNTHGSASSPGSSPASNTTHGSASSPGSSLASNTTHGSASSPGSSPASNATHGPAASSPSSSTHDSTSSHASGPSSASTHAPASSPGSGSH